MSLVPALAERISSLFDYAQELDHRDADEAAGKEDFKMLNNAIDRVAQYDDLTPADFERAKRLAESASSWEWRLKAERVRLIYLVERDKVNDLVATFARLAASLELHHLPLVPYEDLSWLLEETDLLPALLAAISKVVIHAEGRLKDQLVEGVLKSLAWLVEQGGYKLGEDQEDVQVLLDHARSNQSPIAVSRLPMEELFAALKGETAAALRAGSVFPLAEVFGALSAILARDEKEQDEATHKQVFTFLLPLLRLTLRASVGKGGEGSRKVVAYECYTFLRVLGLLHGRPLPEPMWKLVLLLFRFLHRTSELNSERALLLHQGFIDLAAPRLLVDDAESQKLFVALRLNVWLRGLLVQERRCLSCQALTPAKAAACPSCADVQYCNAECRRLDQGKHEKECGRRPPLLMLAAERGRVLPPELEAPSLEELVAALEGLRDWEEAQGH